MLVQHASELVNNSLMYFFSCFACVQHYKIYIGKLDKALV